MSRGWAPLDDWILDESLPGYLSRPDYDGWLRTPDGRWWSRLDIEQAQREMKRGDRRARLLERIRERTG